MRSLVLASIALAAAPLLAQENPAKPALVSDVTIRTNDSALVAAAKRTVARRQNLSGQQGRWVVDDSYLRNASGRISQSKGPVINYGTAASDPMGRRQQCTSSLRLLLEWPRVTNDVT